MWYVVRSKCGLRSPPPTREDEEELVSEAAKRPLRRSRCCISHKRTICGAVVPISLGNSESYRRHGDGVDANGRDRPFLRVSRGMAKVNPAATSKGTEASNFHAARSTF